MMNSLPSQTRTFTTEQRRLLGQVYDLILSWRNEKKKSESTSSEETENRTDVTVQPERPQSGGIND